VAKRISSIADANINEMIEFLDCAAIGAAGVNVPTWSPERHVLPGPAAPFAACQAYRS
jgi:hypothetical protein